MWKGNINAMSAQMFQEGRPWRRLILGLRNGQVFHGSLKDPSRVHASSALAHGELIDVGGTIIKEGRMRVKYEDVTWTALDDMDKSRRVNPFI